MYSKKPAEIESVGKAIVRAKSAPTVVPARRKIFRIAPFAELIRYKYRLLSKEGKFVGHIIEDHC